ncbi:GntG family PLP-dependent aldolase [Desulfitobacterium sp.]|uniref:threonine aldolase family protein n=1 Tax=Desulfitobacterium sp. TaxID=49981 RepID=UPI002BEFA69F|nr:GntG family PLP-dependent aldolase [Desulfitobacterium sp.]HVJ47665.1 GntG family PLP-dependent aldolase [Desulfitobacterium sp.]
MNQIRDYRSDAATLPTFEMRQAMANAEVGDDFSGEDPTVRYLENMSAHMFGKEASLFVISGTMANQIAIMTATQHGDEVLVGEESHIYNMETGGLAALSGVQTRPLRSTEGQFDFQDVRRAIRKRGIQFPITKVLCLENTYDLNRGIPLSEEYMTEISILAHRHDLLVYLDGARIFNAVTALKVEPKIFCQGIDVMQFSLCKGLSAPVGCILLGSKDFIERARRIRQRIGGGMAQAGHMAATGIVALKTMIDRIQDDHLNAKRLAIGLANLNESLVDVEKTLTNIVQIDLKSIGKDAFYMDNALQAQGIKVKIIDSTTCRLVTHRGITDNDIDETIDVIKNILK